MKRHHKNYLTGAVGLAIIAFLLVAVLYNQLMNLYETNTAGPPSESLTVLVLKEKKGMSEPCPEGSDGFATRNLTGQENTSVDYCQQKLSDSPEFVTIAVSKAYDAI